MQIINCGQIFDQFFGLAKGSNKQKKFLSDFNKGQIKLQTNLCST